MTPDITALVARLKEKMGRTNQYYEVVAALREQAREIERLTQENKVIAGHLGLDKLVAERDTLRAEVTRLQDDLLSWQLGEHC